MARKVGYPYDKFMDWLILEQGLSLITATGYASQSRRIIRSCGVSDVCNLSLIKVIKGDQIEEFILGLNKKSQTPFRRSWKQFHDFMKTENHQIACIDLDRGWENIPREIAQALRDLNEQEFPFRLIPSMKWIKDQKLSTYLKKIVIDVDGRKIIMPTEPLLIITQWAYGDREPTEADYIVPRTPNASVPMPLTMMRKVAGII